MSLINDALKRAKHAQQKSPPPTSPGLVLRPIESGRGKQSNLVTLLPLAVVVLAGVGGLMIWFAMGASGIRPSPTTVVQARSASPPAATQRKPTPMAQTSLETPLTKAASTQPVASPSASAPPARAPEATPAQSISQPSSSIIAATVSPAPVSASVPASAAPTATIPQAVVVASGPPPPPALPKLQGIFYRPERPAALLDGKMVLVGRTSGEYHVVAISQQSVTVMRAGQTNILNMPD